MASIRDTIPAYNTVGQLFGELLAYLGQNRAAPQGYCAAIWHHPEYQEKNVDAEVMMAIPQSLQGNQRIQVRDLPALDLVASVIHRGPYSKLNQAYGAIVKWIEDNDYQIVGYNREVYLEGGAEQDNPNYVTEIQFPVMKAAA
ncbi:MAG: GyrI-like domain-containing protein [Cyanobacteria bacterium J06559_3]